MAPCISIFIVNYNTRELLEQCLESIYATKGDIEIEVFVADNCSRDGSPDMVESMFPGVSLTKYTKNMGFTKAINPLLALGKGDYFLLIHPDLEMLPTTFRRFVDFFEQQAQAGIVGGNLFYPDGSPNPCEILFPSIKNNLVCLMVRLFQRLPGGRKLFGDLNPLEWSHKDSRQVNWVWNACMMIRREILNTIGYFDENFYVWYADWDLCKRAADNGWSVHYLHTARAIHFERQSYNKNGAAIEEVRYKIDGWHCAPRMALDRYTFLKKYCGRMTLVGIKVIDVVQNMLSLWLIMGGLIFRKGAVEKASLRTGACVKTIGAILRA